MGRSAMRELWKVLVAGFSILVIATVVSKSLRRNAAVADESRPLSEILASVADDMNAKRGQAINGLRIEKASVRGNKLVLDFIVPNAPLSFDGAAANSRATQNMISIYCKKQFESLLRRGTVIVHNFQSEGGRDIADGRIDAASCKLSKLKA